MVEGIEHEKTPYVSMSDLKNEDFVGYSQKLKDFNAVKPAGKTPTWLVSAEKARKMIHQVIKEKKLGEENSRKRSKHPKIRFDRRGIRAFPLTFSRPAHNCLTWAQEKLRMLGIHLIDFTFDYFVALTSNYTEGGFITESDVRRQSIRKVYLD